MQGGMKALAIGAMLALAGPAQAAWITSWAASPVTPMAAMGPFPATPSFENRTLRQTLRLSAGGSALRIRISNAYGKQPLKIGAARIALVDAGGGEVPGSRRTLRFAGAAGGTVARAGSLASDTVKIAVPPLARVAVSLYLPGETGPCTCHQTGLDDTEVSPPGDFVTKPFRAETKNQSRAFLAAVEVDAPPPARTVVVLGDSISDGVGSTAGANRRWPDVLAERLAARRGPVWGVANAGISGNRVLQGGMGESALARLDRDVLSAPGVAAVILFEGVNDLGMAYGKFEGPIGAAMASFAGRRIDADQIIAGYREIVARAHARHVKVFGATIAPYKGATYWTPEGEAARAKINGFIRSGGLFDGVIDFDAVLRDPADPQSMRADYHMGDHLHGNDLSYQAMGKAVDLALFRK